MNRSKYRTHKEQKTRLFLENLAAAFVGCVFLSLPVILSGLGMVKG
jgi:hypothetical protein